MDYDEEGHVYSDNGTVIPSVTQILSPPSSYYGTRAAQRGTEAHEACAAYARDDRFLPVDPYVYAFAEWCFKRSPKWLAIEEMVEGEIQGMRYAGRLDGLAMIESKLTVIDWKTGVKAKWHRAQVGAYSIVKKPASALVLYLHDDTTYTEDWVNMAEGIKAFRDKIEEHYESMAKA